MRRAATILLGGLMTLISAHPAQATTIVDIVNFAFSPTTTSVAMGSTVSWHNTTTSTTHTSTQDTGVWNTGNITGGSTKSATLSWAATYPYHCAIHPSMVATVKVPIQVAPTSGTTATTFTITFATAALPSGYTMTVQERVGTGSWTRLHSGLTSMSTTFTASSTGTYSFRSILVKTAGGKTKPSPKKSITVS